MSINYLPKHKLIAENFVENKNIILQQIAHSNYKLAVQRTQLWKYKYTKILKLKCLVKIV